MAMEVGTTVHHSVGALDVEESSATNAPHVYQHMAHTCIVCTLVQGEIRMWIPSI